MYTVNIDKNLGELWSFAKFAEVFTAKLFTVRYVYIRAEQYYRFGDMYIVILNKYRYRGFCK